MVVTSPSRPFGGLPVRRYLLPAACVLLAALANSIAQQAAPQDDPKTAIFLSQSTIAELRAALSVSDTREYELRAEVDKWTQALEIAQQGADRVASIDEHDKAFHHPLTKSPSNPDGFFSPFNAGIKRRLVAEAQQPVEEATGRLAFAKRALTNYLESLR